MSVIALACIPANALPLTEFTSWTPDHAYVGTFNISNASASDDWKFIVHDTESGIIYKLYSISDASVKATNTSTTDVTLEASNLSNGQYYILQMIPNIEITQYDTNNVSSNVEFVLSESTLATDISYVLKNVTSGNTYKIYDPTTLTIYGSGSVTGSNATINVTGLPDGRYRIAETGSERILFTYWNPANTTCNGIVTFQNFSALTRADIVLKNVTAGRTYSLYNPTTRRTIDTGLATTSNATLSAVGLENNQTYWIVQSLNGSTSNVKNTVIDLTLIVPSVVIASLIYKRRRSKD